MAKVFYVSPGRSYTVTAAEGTTITYPGIVTPAATVGASGSVTFNCTGTEITVSDDSAQIVQNFNNAGAAVAGAGEGSGGGSLEGVALLEGGNSFSGDQSVTGDVTINGALTVSGDVTAEGEYSGAEVIETPDAIIMPEDGKYYKYTGTGDIINVVAPTWDGYTTISYLETAEPVDLQGVTWSPAKPSLTGAGPFVYTLVCAESGIVLASVMNYSVATAEAIQEVVPMAWGSLNVQAKTDNTSLAIAVGNGASTVAEGVTLGYKAKASKWNGTAIGFTAEVNGARSIALTGRGGKALKPAAITIGSALNDTSGEYTCITEGTGSITIGVGANTLNNGDTESSNAVTIGCKASNSGADSVVIGAQAHGTNEAAVIIGGGAQALGNRTVAVGNGSTASQKSIAIGYNSKTYQEFSLALGTNSDARAKNTIAIGSAATITNTTSANGTVTDSENTTVIGYSASASAPNAVVLGAGASSIHQKTVAVGVQSEAIGGNAASVGYQAKAVFNGTAIGANAKAAGNSVCLGYDSLANQGLYACAIGTSSKAYGKNSIAIGFNAQSADIGAIVLRSIAEDGTYTQLYFSGANTPLANTYEDGEAMMGYVVCDSAGNIMTDAEGNAMVGTQKLSVLFPNNRGENAFTPSMTDLDEEYTSKPMFHPSDLDLLVEEPTAPEDVEINIPESEPEEYIPLPVYPIIEPEIPSEL